MGTCSTEQIKSLKIDLNGFLQIMAERGKVERFYLFFSAKNFPLQRKYCGEKPQKSGEKHEKNAKKRLKNSQKTVKNSRKTTKNRVKNAINSYKNAKIKPFLAQKRASKTTKNTRK